MSPFSFIRRSRASAWLVAVCLVVAVGPAWAGATPEQVARFTKVYESAGEAYRAAPQDTRKAWEFARACFDRADVISSEKVKASVASEGIAACRKALESAPADAPSYYYLGLNLGQLAQTKSLGALKLVRQMEEAWKTAKTLDAPFDFAGADRSLGLLYAEVPRPPLSIGSKDKARTHMENAVKLAPDHPENRIFFAELLLKWGDKTKALEQLEAIETILPGARGRLSGDEWKSAWIDWDRRVEALRKKLR